MNNLNQSNFASKAWTASAIFLFSVAAFVLILLTFNILLLIFAGSLITLYFYGLSSSIKKKSSLPFSLSLVISIAGTVSLIAFLFWLIGSTVHSQIIQLSEILPEGIEDFREAVMRTDLGQWLLEMVETQEARDALGAWAGRIFQSTFGFFGDIFAIIIIGFFFTLSPFLYTRGLITLIPLRGRGKAEKVLGNLGKDLQSWIKGQLIAMFAVFLLSAAGLGIIGAPAWLTLALLAGILNFIPNFGPFITAVIGGLIGLTESLSIALLIVGLLVTVQIIESTIITPSVQKRLIRVPPALIFIPQLVMGVLVGGWGIVFALPLTVVVMVLVRELYVKRQDQSA